MTLSRTKRSRPDTDKSVLLALGKSTSRFRSAIAGVQSDNAQDALEIGVPVILDLDPAALWPVMNRHVGSEVLTQLVLQIGDRRGRNVDLRGPTPSFPTAELARDQTFGLADAVIAPQNCFRELQLFFRRFDTEQNFSVPN